MFHQNFHNILKMDNILNIMKTIDKRIKQISLIGPMILLYSEIYKYLDNKTQISLIVTMNLSHSEIKKNLDNETQTQFKKFTYLNYINYFINCWNNLLLKNNKIIIIKSLLKTNFFNNIF